MNQVATQVADQEVPAEHALQMHQLMVEVNNQRMKIEEISRSLRHGMTPKGPESETSSFHLVSVEQEELETWEQEVQVIPAELKTPPRKQVHHVQENPKMVIPGIQTYVKTMHGVTGSHASCSNPGVSEPTLQQGSRVLASPTTPQIMKMGSPVKDQYWTSLGHKVLCSNGETRKSPGERSIQTRSTRLSTRWIPSMCNGA